MEPNFSCHRGHETKDQNNFVRLQMKVLLRDLDGDASEDYTMVHLTTLFDKHINSIFGKKMKPETIRSLSMDEKITLADHLSDDAVYKVVYVVNKKGYVAIRKITLFESVAESSSGHAESK